MEEARRREKTLLRELRNATMKYLFETDDTGLDKLFGNGILII
jgi:hypothetical protein